MTGGASFSALPAELRMVIADYLFEQPDNVAFKMATDRTVHPLLRLCFVQSYSAASYLRPLLVCRQFYKEFRLIAYNKTTFVLTGRQPDGHYAASLPGELLRSVRKVVLYHSKCESIYQTWSEYPFNIECLQLDELVFAPSPTLPASNTALAVLLYNLQHVKKCKFVADTNPNFFKSRYAFAVSRLLKEDYEQRFLSPGGPNIGNTWWEWSYDEVQLTFTMQSQAPLPVLTEEEHTLRMKPYRDELLCIA